MSMDEIPTPETDAAEAACRESKGCVNLVFVDDMADLERRLTIARETLTMIIDTSPSLQHAERMADEALKLTAPTP